MLFALPQENDKNRPRTQAERSSLAETRMVMAAIDLLNDEGIQGTTLVAIGKKSGYSRGLATHHFGSKAGLFRTVLKRLSLAWTAELNEKLGDRTGLDAIEMAIDTHLSWALRHPDYIRAQYILWGAAIDPSTGFKPNVSEFMRIQRETVTSWIEEGRKKCEIANRADSKHVAEQFYGGLIGITYQWQVSPDFDLPSAYTDFKLNLLRLLGADESDRRTP
jgi:AcrR family transcriptional regulator